ncbi:MAG: hypothetical protein ACYDAL_07780 [Candidatus Dormibacteraceae bacterium]
MPKTEPFTVRLNPRIESRITKIARETKRSKGAVLEELADEAERTRRFPGIAFRGPNWSRRAWVLGTALDVWEIVQAFKDYGQKGDKMLAETALAPRQLRIALAYYREFTAEIDEAIAANQRTTGEIEAEYPFLEVMRRAD